MQNLWRPEKGERFPWRWSYSWLLALGSVYWELSSGALVEQSWSHVFIIHSRWCCISIWVCLQSYDNVQQESKGPARLLKYCLHWWTLILHSPRPGAALILERSWRLTRKHSMANLPWSTIGILNYRLQPWISPGLPNMAPVFLKLPNVPGV